MFILEYYDRYRMLAKEGWKKTLGETIDNLYHICEGGILNIDTSRWS